MIAKDSTERGNGFRRWGAPVVAWAVCALGVVATYFRPSATALDEDEIYWVGSAYYFDLAWRSGDWGHADWRLLPARENPPVAKYAIGLGLAAAGRRVDSPEMLGCFYLHFERIPGAWGGGEHRAKREAVAARVSPALRERLRQGAQLNLDSGTLQPARWTMLVCALAASALALAMGGRNGGWVTGLLASQLLLLHPVIVGTYNHAMSDAVALAFSCLAAWWGFQLAGRALEDRPWTRATALGLTGGSGLSLALAAGAKMNSLVVVAWFALAAGAAATLAWRKQGRARGLAVLGTGLGSLGVALLGFIAINPAIWPDAIDGLIACVREHRLTEGIQAGFLAGRLETLAARLDAVVRLGMLGYAGLAVALLAAGWALAAGNFAERGLAAWWLLAVVVVAAWIPFERERYVVPVVAPTVLLVAWLLGRQLPAAWRRFRGRT